MIGDHMGNKVILTGGTGFIGSNLARHMHESGYEVHFLSRRHHESQFGEVHVHELLDKTTLSDFFRKIGPDFLVHLASYGVPGRNMDQFEIQYVNTVAPTLNLAKLIPDNLKLALFVGSCEEYGNSMPPFKEDHAPCCFSPYGWGKISAFYGTYMIARQRGINWCWVRPFLTFGPDQIGEQLIPTLIDRCLKDEDVLLTKGEQTRDFIYVDDLCAMISTVLKNHDKANGEVINLCSGTQLAVKDMATRIHSLIGKGRLKFGALDYRNDEAMAFYGSNEKYVKLFGHPRLSDLNMALSQTIEHYKQMIAEDRLDK